MAAGGGAGNGRKAAAGRATVLIRHAGSGLGLLFDFLGGNIQTIRAYARQALRLGRFILRAALIPQLLLCLLACASAIVLTLSMPLPLRLAYGLSALLIGLLCFRASLRMARLAGSELAEDLREVLRESPRVAEELKGLLLRRQTAWLTAQGGIVSQGLSLFLRILRLSGRAAAAAGQLAVPGLLDLSRLPFWLLLFSCIALAWLPYVFAGQLASFELPGLADGNSAAAQGTAADPGAAALLLRHALLFAASSLLSLPPLGMLAVLLVARRAANYIGIAEAILDEGAAESEPDRRV